MNKSAESYFIDGCGRCPLWKTANCKVQKWHSELKLLRKIILSTDLKEECKWGVPCYTWNNKNIILLNNFKGYCAINFFKGSLLKDKYELLISQTDNIQATRQIRIKSVQEIEKLKSYIIEYIYEAIEIEKKGIKVNYKKTIDFIIPEELQSIFEKDTEFKNAFNSLTPGRQRGYIIFFSQAKQAKTRIDRIEKYYNKIFEGKGMND